MTFNDFDHKYKLKDKATSNIKIKQVLSSLCLNDVEIFLRDDPFKTDTRINNLHLTKGTHWVLSTKIILIVMMLLVQRNYLNLL